MERKIRDVMTPEVQVISPDTPIQEAAQKMKQLDVGMLPVCEDDRLIGSLTDRDIAIRVVAGGNDPKTTKARAAMTAPLVYCFEDDAVEDAARIMEVKQIRRLVVLNREKQLVGIVSLGDFAVKAGRDSI